MELDCLKRRFRGNIVYRPRPQKRELTVIVRKPTLPATLFDERDFVPPISYFFASLLLISSCWNAFGAPLAITNHRNGSIVRYPVILLRGTFEANTKDFTIHNVNAPENAKPVNVVQHNGRFKALVELTRGRNQIELRRQKPAKVLKLEITYRPQTNPYYVRLIWMTDKSGNTEFAAPTDETPQDYEARLRTAAQLMQTFTAERMNDLGFGHRTFRLERDDQGQVIVHTLKAPENAEYYYQLPDGRWWNEIYRWIDKSHPDPFAKNIVLAAYTRKDPETNLMKGHTALGGGNLGLFGSASVFSWPSDIGDAANVFLDARRVDPTKVHDDSAGRGTYWGLASTTIGATLHEMGHTFGLPHCRDRLGIMTRGFDHFNRVFTFQDPPSGRNRQAKQFDQGEEAYFAPTSASYLKWSLWFQLDKTHSESNARPTILVNTKKKVVELRCDAGLPWVGFWVGADIYSYKEFPNDNLPKKLELSFEEIGKYLNGKPLSRISVIGGNGLSSSAKVE